MSIFSINSFCHGNPDLIATPMDPDHIPCGKGEMSGKINF